MVLYHKEVTVQEKVPKTSLDLLLEKILRIGLNERRRSSQGVDWVNALDLRGWKDWIIDHVIEKPTISNNGTSQEVKVRYLFKQKNELDGYDTVSGMNILVTRKLPAEKFNNNPSTREELSSGCEWCVVSIRYCKDPMSRNKIDLLEAEGKGHPDAIKGVVIKNS